MGYRHSSRSSSVGTASQMQKLVSVILVAAVLLQCSSSVVDAWEIEGHRIICSIAEQMLNPIALASVEELLPDTVDGNLSNLCSWADDVRRIADYEWSVPLHYIDTPDKLCAYDPIRMRFEGCYIAREGEMDKMEHNSGLQPWISSLYPCFSPLLTGDCMNGAGIQNSCAAGAIRNFTYQLTVGGDEYNLTEALLFLSHIVGDIHQPLHVGFESDHGGNKMKVYWFNALTNLHNVWDTNLVMDDIDEFFDGDSAALARTIRENITGIWSKQAAHWANCAGGETTCPDVYATESIYLACHWAYRDAGEEVLLEKDYFLSRLPVLHLRIAQAGVRLASLLNRIYPDDELKQT